MEIIIEQITRNKKILSYRKLSGDKIKIGRAYDNDIVLQEEHVSPYHAELDIYNDDEVMVLSDNNSTNGIKDKDDKAIESSVRVSSGDVFSIGKTYIRILRADHPVAEAKEMSYLEDIASHFNKWYFAAMAIALFAGVMAFATFVTAFEEVIWSKLMAKNAMVALTLVLVPAVISVFSRFFKKEVRFFAAIVFCFAVFIFSRIFDGVSSWLYFNWPNSVIFDWFVGTVEFAMITLLVWGAIYLASNMPMKRITSVSLILVLTGWGLLSLSKQNDQVIAFPTYVAAVLPDQLNWAQAMSANEHVEQQQSLFESASKEAKRRNKEAND